MRIRGAVLERIGAPRNYAESRPLTVTDLDLAPPGADETGRKATRGAGSEPTIVPAIEAPKVVPAAKADAAAEGEPEEGGEEPAKIVSLDAFRKKT